MVPVMATLSGTMFMRLPPWMAPTVMTAGSSMLLSWRLGMVCKPRMICELTTIGSMPDQGRAPCVCLPVTSIQNWSAAAMAGPLRHDSQPAG
ncbi:hypothetical protein D3C71_1626810 [compost metagenome]